MNETTTSTNASLLVSVCHAMRDIENRGVLNIWELKAYAGLSQAYQGLLVLAGDVFADPTRIRDLVG